MVEGQGLVLHLGLAPGGREPLREVLVEALPAHRPQVGGHEDRATGRAQVGRSLHEAVEVALGYPALAPAPGGAGAGRIDDHDVEPAALANEALHPLHGVSVDHVVRSEEHTSELQSLMRISYAVFCLKKKQYTNK